MLPASQTVSERGHQPRSLTDYRGARGLEVEVYERIVRVHDQAGDAQHEERELQDIADRYRRREESTRPNHPVASMR